MSTKTSDDYAMASEAARSDAVAYVTHAALGENRYVLGELAAIRAVLNEIAGMLAPEPEPVASGRPRVVAQRKGRTPNVSD